MLRTPSTEITRTVLKKFGKSISVSTDKLVGKYTILNYRKYSHYEEVDVSFEGKVRVRYNGKAGWYSTSDMSGNISKVKFNRFLRRSLEPELERFLKYFSVKIAYYGCIKKIKWI